MLRTHKKMKAGRRKAFTTVEIVISSALVLVFGTGLTSLIIMSGNMHKSIYSQQISLKDAKSAIETINREIRMAQMPITLVNPNRVEYQHVNVAATRAIELLPGDDGSFGTPWDNRLILVDDVGGGASPCVIIRNVSPFDEDGAFSLDPNSGALVVHLRTGDPVFGDSIEASNNRTGIGLQGIQIDISVGPRN